jgi:hypothetical protein
MQWECRDGGDLLDNWSVEAVKTAVEPDTLKGEGVSRIRKTPGCWRDSAQNGGRGTPYLGQGVRFMGLERHPYLVQDIRVLGSEGHLYIGQDIRVAGLAYLGQGVRIVVERMFLPWT